MEINLHRIPFNDRNEPQMDLVREFSMQVHHNRLSISANGFSRIDLNLLGSVQN